MADFLIISGAPRSGTTMLGATLNSLPELAVFAEFSLTNILQWIEESLFSGMEDAQLAPHDPDALEQFLRPTISEHGTQLWDAIYKLVYPGKTPRILGNKIPSLAAGEDIDYLLSKIPNLKIIYMIRNCRSVIQSSMTKREKPEHVSDTWLLANEKEVIDEWVYSFFVGRYLARITNALLVKYEDLLSAPDREANRIARYLGVTGLDFTISQPRNIVAASSKTLDASSGALNSMLERWDEMNIAEIMMDPLDAEFSRLSRGWRPMGLPTCDIGTHENFHRPEPWGCWSKPGYFALRPRFYDTGAKVALILLHFYEKKAILEAVGLRCTIGSIPAKIIEIVDLGDDSRVVVRASQPWVGEGLVINVFFAHSQNWDSDPRKLGLRLKRYSLLSSADDFANLHMR
jgi:hypothetical protein